MPTYSRELVYRIRSFLDVVDAKLFFGNIVVSFDSLVVAHDQSPPTQTLYLVKRLPIIDLVDTSMIQALWLPGLLMNGSMQKFVTSTSGDLYPASKGIIPLMYVLGGTAPPALMREFYESHSFGHQHFPEFSFHCVLVCIHDHYDSVPFLSPFPTLRGKVSVEQFFWPCVDVLVLAISF